MGQAQIRFEGDEMNCCDGLIPIPLTLRSWGYSLFLHVVLWGVAGWVWSQEFSPPQHGIFQWDVALVSNLPIQSERRILAQAPRVVRQGSRPIPASVADSAAAAHESMTEESRTSADAVETTPVIHAHLSRGSGASQAGPFDQAVVPESIPPAVAEVLRQDINNRASPMAESAEGVSSANPVPVPSLDEVSAQLAAEAARENGPSIPVLRGEPQEIREDAAAPAPGPVRGAALSSDAIGESQPPPAAIRSELAAAVTTGSAAVQANQDFGWLMRTLWNRVAELKRYPHEARLNHWQGKVVVRAVIDEQGRLLEVTIATSSGHEALDRAAVEVIKRSCPLALQQPLGQSQIVLRVPIQFRLDS